MAAAVAPVATSPTTAQWKDRSVESADHSVCPPRCSYSHCCCATVPKYEGEARKNWIEQVALKLREAANAVQPLMPSDVHVDHTATACEGGDCPLLRRAG